MIRDPDRYREFDEEDRWEALRKLSPEESIAIGEALLTSEVMNAAVSREEDRPVCLAMSLGIAPRFSARGE